MTIPRELVDRRTYAVPLRAVAVFVAITTAVWEIAGRGGVDATGVGVELWMVRVLETAVALAVAWLASPARSIATLRALIWVLALDIAVANLAVMVLLPAAVWESLFVVVMVMMGAALFAPWSWRWQAWLAGTIGLGTWIVASVTVPVGVIPAWLWPRLGLALLAAAVASVLGTWIKERERYRVAMSEARFRGLFDAAGDAIAVLSPEGVIADGNVRFEALLGRSVRALRSTGLCEFWEPAADREGVRPSCEELLEEVGARPRTVTGTLTRPDGRAIEVEVTLVRMPGPEGSVTQAIFRDMTERRALERRHVQTQRVEAIARLAGGLAHQFNNLLGGILNQATLLRREAKDPAFQTQLDAIAHAARRGERLTKELLRFTPHAAVSVQAVPVSKITASVRALARTERGDPLEIDAAAGLPPIAADPDHLVPALMELIFNAWDATRTRPDRAVRLSVGEERVVDGDVRWSGAAAGRYVSFAVIDRGVGMDAATRERLFEPFFTTKPMYEAEGLGLAAVYWVVRAHQGAIAIDSAPDKGTTVRLLVPVAEGAAVPPPAPRPAESASVLVVDDDALIRKTAERALRQFGYRAQVAEDGDGALRALADGPLPDLAILDVVMPGGGAKLMDRIRREYPEVRVLISSGYGPGGEVRQMLDMGARGFLQKPYEISELREAVEEALR